MKRALLFLFLILSHGPVRFAGAQTLPEPLRQAEALRLGYRFEEAAAIFSAIAAESRDSVLRRQAADQLLLCENGQVMLRYIETPVVTGKKAVPANLFFHYYTIDLPGEWAQLPENLLQAKTDDRRSPVFIPGADAGALYFAAQTTGDWDIYVIRHVEGTQWAAPEPLESVNTPFDERFPYVTPDGQTLYFASNGHSGMGGFDLFKSTFNAATQQWGAPENLGFPYSSPFDDWLFVPDRNYAEALFASSREQKTDSLTIYRIALETNPTKQPGRSIPQVRQIAKLQPARAETDSGEDKRPGENPDSRYRTLHRTLQQQQVNETLVQNDLAYIRKMYALIDDEEERTAVQAKINDYENGLLQMQEGIRKTMEQIREVEKNLLEQGIVPEPAPGASAQAAAAAGPAHATLHPLYFRPAIKFPVNNILPPPPAAQEEDGEKYIFKIGKTVHTFFNPPVTAGLIYRIQTGTFSRRLPERELKGCSPVFVQQEKKLFIYSVGQFATYREAGNALLQVKKQGFRDAIIIALIDGKKTAVKAAREYEATHRPSPKTMAAPVREKGNAAADTGRPAYNVVLGGYSDKLPAALRQAVQQHTDKDIVKSRSQGHTVYTVGPFAALADAEKLQAQLKTGGFEVTIE
jgi:hypothetical protein